MNYAKSLAAKQTIVVSVFERYTQSQLLQIIKRSFIASLQAKQLMNWRANLGKGQARWKTGRGDKMCRKLFAIMV